MENDRLDFGSRSEETIRRFSRQHVLPATEVHYSFHSADFDTYDAFSVGLPMAHTSPRQMLPTIRDSYSSLRSLPAIRGLRKSA